MGYKKSKKAKGYMKYVPVALFTAATAGALYFGWPYIKTLIPNNES